MSSPTRIRRVIAGPFLLLVIATATQASLCTKENPTGYTPEVLGRLPEAKLLYPDSAEVPLGLQSGRSGPASLPTGVIHIAATDATAEAVVSFYAAELGQSGWVAERNAIRGSGDLSAIAWRKGDFLLNLAIRDHRSLQREFALYSYPTVYEVRIFADPVKAGTATPTPIVSFGERKCDSL